jgi:hypothetical protein
MFALELFERYHPPSGDVLKSAIERRERLRVARRTIPIGRIPKIFEKLARMLIRQRINQPVELFFHRHFNLMIVPPLQHFAFR